MKLSLTLKLTSTLLSMAIAGFASAEPEFLDIWMQHYKVSESSTLGAKSCGVCHVSESDYQFNPYGKQLAGYLSEHNLKAVDDNVLVAVGKMDANSNGKTNDEDIQTGGDPAVGAPATAPAAAPTPPKPKPLVPKNMFHPAIVHFPIALLITGILLDLAGLIWKKTTLLYAGWYNTVIGAVTALGAVLSGLGAMFFMKLPYKGLIFDHLKLAIAVTVIMWIMVAMRVHKHEEMKVGARVIYYLLAALAFAAISVTGHLGGEFVYGG